MGKIWDPNPGGALECNLRGGAHFLRIFTTRSGKNAFRYPVSVFLDYKTIGGTIAYCS